MSSRATDILSSIFFYVYRIFLPKALKQWRLYIFTPRRLTSCLNKHTQTFSKKENKTNLESFLTGSIFLINFRAVLRSACLGSTIANNFSTADSQRPLLTYLAEYSRWTPHFAPQRRQRVWSAFRPLWNCGWWDDQLLGWGSVVENLLIKKAGIQTQTSIVHHWF